MSIYIFIFQTFHSTRVVHPVQCLSWKAAFALSVKTRCVMEVYAFAHQVALLGRLFNRHLLIGSHVVRNSIFLRQQYQHLSHLIFKWLRLNLRNLILNSDVNCSNLNPPVTQVNLVKYLNCNYFCCFFSFYNNSNIKLNF